MLYNGRLSGIKDGIGFQQGNQSNVKLNAPKRLSNFVKGKVPMVQDNEGYILYPANYPEHKIRKIHARKPHNISHHAFMYKNEASSSRHTTHIKMPKKKISAASNEHNVSFKTFDASYVLTNKSDKVVAKYVRGKHKSSKTCVWVLSAFRDRGSLSRRVSVLRAPAQMGRARGRARRGERRGGRSRA